MSTYLLVGFLSYPMAEDPFPLGGGSGIAVDLAPGTSFSYSYNNSGTPNSFGVPEANITGADMAAAMFGITLPVYHVFRANLPGGEHLDIFTATDSASGIAVTLFLDSSTADFPSTPEDITATMNSISSATTLPGGSFSYPEAPFAPTEGRDVHIDEVGLAVSYDLLGGDDVYYALDGNETIWGNLGNDRIVSTGTGATLNGDEGNDILKFKGSGSGTINGGDGEDRIYGALFSDGLLGGDGTDLIFGNGGNDGVYGDDGDDYLYGGRGNDFVEGGAGNDLVRGNLNDDILAGRTGDDRLFGGGGQDTLTGDEGRDFLLGENGNDLLIGGAGNDNMTGGAGKDSFFFNENDSGYDRILDFELGVDTIGLAGGVYDAVNLSQVLAVASDTSAGVRLNFGGGNVILIEGVSEAQLTDDTFGF